MADVGVGFVDILPRTDKFVSTLSAQMNAGLAKVSAQTSATSKIVSGLSFGFIALGAAAAAGIAKAISSTVEWSREVLTLQRVTGQSAESASALLAVMGSFGLSAQQATVGLGIFDKNIINNTANLTKYGIATEDAQGNLLPFDTILGNAADKFVSLDNAQQQAAFAMNAFGRSGKSLIPILRQGAAGIEELKVEAEATGLVIGQDTVDAAVALGRQQRELNESFKGLSVTIGQEFLPIATDLLTWATKLVQVLAAIPGPVYEVVLGFTVLTGALSLGIKLVTGSINVWSKLVTSLKGVTAASVEAEAAQGQLFATQGAASAGLTGLGVAALTAASAIAVIVGWLVVMKRDADAAHASFEEGINQDIAKLAAGGEAAKGVEKLANAVKITSQTQQDSLGMTRGAVLAYNRSIDQANEAQAQWNHTVEITGSSMSKTTTSIKQAFADVTSLDAAFADITDGTALLNKNLGDTSDALGVFAKRSGADVEGILGNISKVVNDAKSTVGDVVAAYQGGIQQLIEANKQWHESIVSAFGGAGSALEQFADKTNVSIGSAIGSLRKYTSQIHAFGSDIATIQDRFGKAAGDFIQWASTQGLAQAGLVDAVANSNKKMGDSFISNFKRADQATNDLANQIQKALDPVFDRIIFELQNVVRVMQGIPPLKFKADTSDIDRAIADVKGGLASLPTQKVVTIITRRESSGHALGGPIGFAAGGTTDTIPAMLSPGEFVLRKSAVDRIGVPALQQMNQGGAVTTSISKPQKLDGSMRIYDWRNGLASLDGELVWEDAVRTR